MLKGSEDETDKNYSTVSVDNGITLEGWSGIFIDHNDDNTGYGVLVNMDGTIKSTDDTEGGPGSGIYINGNIKHQSNSPIINLNENTKITSTGNGIYAAGYATYNINGAYIEGKESGLGIKSGEFNIKNSTIIGSGQDTTPTTGNNNGINSSGTAIQIESNKNYSGNIKLNIKSGNITSNNSYTIYEYTVNNSNTSVKNINLSGGTYKSGNNKPVFSLSDNFKNTHPSFISGGSYSSDPTPYLEAGYQATKDNNLYKVIENTISVFNQNTTSNNNSYYIIIIITSIIILLITTYINRYKILKYFK